MDRRVLLAGLFGVAGTAALAAVLPPQAEALAGVPLEDPTPGSSVLPNLADLKLTRTTSRNPSRIKASSLPITMATRTEDAVVAGAGAGAATAGANGGMATGAAAAAGGPSGSGSGSSPALKTSA